MIFRGSLTVFRPSNTCLIPGRASGEPYEVTGCIHAYVDRLRTLVAQPKPQLLTLQYTALPPVRWGTVLLNG